MYRIVLLLEKALSDLDVAEVTTLHEGVGPQSFLVLIPADTEHNRFVEMLDDLVLGRLREAAHDSGGSGRLAQATARARAALDASVAALRAAGVEAAGKVTPDDPLRSLTEAVRTHEADEVIVLTEPHLVEEALHRDWASRARHEVGVPVLKLLAHST
jgi:hypothetical protein